MTPQHKLSEVLADLTRQLLEETCFLFEEEGDTEAGAARTHTHVPFEGAVKGVLEVRTSDMLAASIAANMLGIDSVNADLERDALGEFGNILCGNLLPHLTSGEGLYTIGTPVNQEAASDLNPEAAVQLHYPDGDITVTLLTEKPL